MNISRYLDSKKRAVDGYLLKYLPSGNKYTKELSRSIKYSTIARSKRIRPILALAACEAVGGDAKLAMPLACAIEFIHTYTLIHDDLPAMDDDNWRRGKPANHKVFGEDIAILSGDALNTIAFNLIAEKTGKKVCSDVIVKVIAELSKALVKVVEGQVADLEFEGRKYSKKDLEFIHLNKTASLIKASILCGAMIGGADKSVLRKLQRYAENLGLAFQIVDDILDVTSTRNKLGKTPRKDIAQKKATYPRLIGLENSRKLAQLKISQAIKALQGLGKSYNILRSIAVHLGDRSV